MSKPNSIRFPLTDKMFEVAGICATLVLLVLPFIYYRDLPDEIPTHFGFRGTPDGFGSKGSIWSLPIIGLLLYTGLTLLNYFVIVKTKLSPTEKDGDTLARKNILRLMQMLKLILSVSFAYILWMTIQVALGMSEGLGTWFLPTFLVLLTFLPIVFLLSVAGKSRKKLKS